MGKARIDRDELPETAPRALDETARIRWLRAVEAHLSPRDRALALIPYYAGARISEVLGLDVSDVHRSARKAQLRIWGKGGKPRMVQIHKNLRAELDQWLEERPHWPHADRNPALFLNTKGERLSARAASGIIHTIARNAALDDQPTAHVLRHTLATTLEMSRVASGVSFGKIRELIIPATSPFGLDQSRLAEIAAHAS